VRVSFRGSEAERWHFGDRFYLLTLASTPDSMDLELDDVGPGSGRGTVLIASRDDETGAMTLRSFTDEPLAIELVEAFLAEERRTLPPSA
jgi:hypothetical protein